MSAQHVRVTIVALSLFASALLADDVPAFRHDLLDPLNHAEQELLALAQAIPAEKYSWRPAKDVRSAGEVYQHIANGNNLILTFAADKPLDRKDKTHIIANMKESFERARAVIMKMSQADTSSGEFSQLILV